MGVMNLCLLALSLSASLGMQNIGTYDQMLDPGRINTWRTKWASTQLELSKNNQDAAGVAVTFFINLSNSLVGGVVEVTFPSGFDISGVASMTGAVVSGQTVQVPATISAHIDTKLILTGVTNPAVSGPYGPFALRTRNSRAGQLLDVSLNFGQAFITPTEGKLYLEPVTYLVGSSTVINKGNNGLSFKFTINKTLWAHDLIRIVIAPQFALSNPVCYSVDLPGKVNNFNSTNPADPHSINCVVSSKSGGSQTLWVYGLANDLDVVTQSDNRFFDLRVTGFTNPDRDYPNSGYVWKVETVRFNTMNVIEAGTANGPDTAPDTILVYSWTPTWGRAISTILADQTMYMDVSFKTVNPIPDGSYATISTNVDTATWGSGLRCYVVTYVSTSVACSQTGGVTTVTGLGALPAGTTLTVRTLTKFTSKTNVAKIVSIFTRSAETWAIDTNHDLAGFTFPKSSTTVPFTLNVLLQKADSTSAQKAGGTGAETQYIKFQLQGLTGLINPGYSVVTITCPLAGGADDWQFGIPITSDKLKKAYKVGTSSSDFSTEGTAFNTDAKTASTNSGSVLTITAGSVVADTKTSAFVYKAGSVQFTAGKDHSGTSEFTVALYVSGLTGLSQVISSGAIILPRIATNPSTAYECAASLIDTKTVGKDVVVKKPAYAVGQFQVDMQDFESASNDFTYFCSLGTLGGAPLKITFRPSVVDIYQTTSAQTYYVEIELPTDTYFPYQAGSTTFHLSGLMEGEIYPMDSNLSTSPTMIVTNVGGNNSFFHRITGLGNVSPVSTPVEIYFPVGVARNPNPVIKLRSYFVRAADPRFKHYTHTTTMDTKASSLYTIDTSKASTNTGFLTKSISNGNSQINGNAMGSSNPLSFTLKLDNKITGDVYFYVVFPRGYSFSTLKSVKSDNPSAGSTFGFTKYFSATNLRFAFPSVLVKATTKGAQVGNIDSVISFYGVNVPLGTQSSDIVFVHGDIESKPKEFCKFMYTGILTSVVGKITSISVSPNVVQGRGPNGIDIAHTVIFTLPHGIDFGGSIVLSLSSAWSSTTASTCTVQGLTDVSTTSVVKCTFVGNDFTITNFADFSTTSSTTVTVELSHLLPPAVDYRDDTKILQLVKSLSSFGSASIGATAIDSYELGSNSMVNVLPSLPPGLTNYVSINVQPPNAGTVDNDLFLQLSFPYDLPAWTTISVSIPYPALYPADDIKDRCYLSPLRYRSCGLVGGAVVVVLQEKYTALRTIELFVDHAVNAPSEVVPPVATIKYVFRCLVAWFGAAIVDDGVTSYRDSQEIFPDKKLTAKFATGLTPLTFIPRNALETAVYTLSFQNSVPIAVDDSIYVVWPDEFDPYLGNAEQSYATEVGNFYLSCSSPQLGAAYCRVDHWVMVISGTSLVPASTDVTITINGVKNPGPRATGNFKLMHVNKKGELLEYSGAFGSVTPVALANNVEVRSVSVSNRSLSGVADYTFRFYAAETFTRSTELHVNFPSEYDLKLVDQKNGYSCSTFRVNEAAGSQRLLDTWNPSIACLASGNTVALPPPSAQTQLSSTDLVTVTLTGVKNPEWAQVRYPNSATWDFDVVDSSIWPIWSWWTGQFKINVFQGASSSLSYSARPYGMLNAAYLGFVQPLRTLSVNNYNPQSRANRIIVYPGTQSSDIEISTANSTVPLAATHIFFKARTNTRTQDNGMLSYSSFKDDWVMLQDEQMIRFRVAADKRALKGLYYISWEMEEGLLGSTGLYCLPPITLVEVPVKKTAVYTFAVDQVPAVAVGSTSIPIKVSISNPPHTDVSVNINLLNMPDTVSVSPRSLIFRPDIDSLYFYITVSADHDYTMTPSVDVIFSLSGTNAEAYSVQASYSVPVQVRYVEVQGQIGTLEILDVTRTSFRLTALTEQSGILYYHVSPKGSRVLSFQEIRASLPSFIYTSSDYLSNKTTNAITRQTAASNNDPPEDMTYYEFRHSAFIQHMTTFSKLGGLLITDQDTQDSVQITGLWAGSEYQVVAYLDNLNPTLQQSAMTLQYVSTLPTAENRAVQLRLTGYVPQAASPSLASILAKHLGVSPYRVPLTDYIMVNQTARVLQTNNDTTTPPPTTTQVTIATVFQFTVLASRSVDIPTPADLVDLTAIELADFLSDLASKLAVTPEKFEVMPGSARVEPVWQTAPTLLDTAYDSVRVNFQATGANVACCVALQETDPRLQPDQVWEGFSYDWTSANGACSQSGGVDLNLLSIPNLDSDTTYYVHCVASDGDLLWPTLMQYSETVPVPFFTVHTPQFDTVLADLSGAVLLQLAVWALLN